MVKRLLFLGTALFILVQKISTLPQCRQANITNPAWMKFLTLSQFPGIPPYVRFARPGECVDQFPEILKEQLKWAKTIRPSDKLHADSVFSTTGFTLVDRKFKTSGKQIYGFYDRYISSNDKNDKMNPTFRTSDTKVNHMPNITELDNKLLLSNNLKSMIKNHGKDAFPFVLPSFALPEEYSQFQETCEASPNKVWVRKPTNLSRCVGIKFINGCENVQNKTSVVQQYLLNPMTLHGRKLEFRKYVLITSFDPFRIFVFENELLKISTKNYTTDVSKLDDQCIHTPWSLACKGPRFINRDSKPGLTTNTQLVEFRKQKLNLRRIRADMEDAIIKTLLSAQRSICEASYASVKSRYNTFNLMAFDFFVDKNHKVWLNEVNRRPGTGITAGANVRGVIASSLTLAGYHLPQFLSAKAKKLILKNINKANGLKDPTFNKRFYKLRQSPDDEQKHSKFEPLFHGHFNLYDELILKELTTMEVQQLMSAEDELHRLPSGVKRIFPSATMDKYFKFVEYKPYNYMLFNAWEKKYGRFKNRSKAVSKLLSYTVENRHLT